MGNLSQVRRVVCEHDWQSLAEWPRALDKLADLTDDEIDCLVRSDQQIETSEPVTAPHWLLGVNPPASWGVLQAIRRNIGSRLRSRASKSLVLLLPRVRH